MSGAQRKRQARNAIVGADRGFKVAKSGGAGADAGDRGASNDEDGCPVRAIGHHEGSCILLDFCGQPRTLRERDLGNRAVQMMLFGGDDTWPLSRFPVEKEFKGKDGKLASRLVDYNVNALAKYLIMKSGAAGIVKTSLKFRSIGTWLADDGSVVVHAGNGVLYRDKWEKPGLRTGNQIWAASEAIARPGIPCGPDVARTLQDDLQSAWNYETEAAAISIIGLIFIGYVCGALKWRVNGFVTGPTGSGKTALLKVFRAAWPVHDYSNDTSKAGMEQTIAGRAIPCLIDEAADRNHSAGRDLLDIVLSSSGDDGTKLARGTVDGKGRTSEIVSNVIMFSIYPPPLQPQHLGRFVLLELRKPNQDQDGYARHQAIVAYTRAHGAALWGRAVGAFDRYHECLTLFRAALGKMGCAPREMDSKGALLAGWFVLTNDGLPDERDIANGIGGLQGFLVSARRAAEDDAPARALRHLLGSHVQLHRSSEREPIGELIEIAFSADALRSPSAARDHLMRNGIRVVAACEKSKDARQSLDQECRCVECWNVGLKKAVPRGDRGAGVWVATRNPELQRVFRDSDFDEQKWVTALARCDGSVKSGRAIRIGSVSGYATWLPLSLLDPDDPREQCEV